MKKLNPPILIDHQQCLSEIIDAKRDIDKKNDLLRKKSAILLRYKEYEDLFNSNNLVPIRDSIYKQSDPNLLSCYLSGGKKLAAIKKEIKDLQDNFANEKCMYCQIKDPDSFDHYLPKDLYPEFCSLAINLIPCCVTCNKKKDKYWKELGQPGIINFYINNLPTHQILFADISFPNSDFSTPSVNFKLSKVPEVDLTTYNLIKRHYTRLQLIDRYQDKINSVISELKRILNSFGKKLPAKEEMGATFEYATQLKQDYGINYWKGILLNELSKQEEFYTSA